MGKLNWRKLAKIEKAKWLRTYFNEEQGWRYCIWLAPDENVLKNIFNEMEVPFKEIVPVEETVPDLWGEKWHEHLSRDESADNLGN